MGLPHGVSPNPFYVHNFFLVHIKLSSDTYKFLSVHNTDTPFILKYRQISIVCFHFTCVYTNQHSLCTYTFSLYISNTFHEKYNFYLYITQILFENTFSQINFDLSFLFHLYIQPSTIGIERSIIPCETAFKPMGLSYGVSPNPPMYIHLSLYINTRSCTYSLPCTQFKLVNNQVTLVLNVRFTDKLRSFVFVSSVHIH